MDDQQRVAALRALHVLDTDPEPVFDAIVAEIAEISGAPIALVSLVDEKRQWFKAVFGLPLRETPREYAFCDHAIRSEQPFLVSDALADTRFNHNPLVTGAPGIRAYAGCPLITSGGDALGTLCVIDVKPRTWTDSLVGRLQRLATMTMDLLEMRRRAQLADERLADMRTLLEAERIYKTLFATMREGVVVQDRTSAILNANGGAAAILGLSEDQLLGRTSMDDRWALTDFEGRPLELDEQPSMICLATGQPVLDYRLRVSLPEGGQRWLQINSLPVFEDGDPVPVQTVTTFFDVSELVQRKAELEAAVAAAERANEAKSVFLTNMSHEIRTPLNGVIALASALGQTSLDARQREMVDIIVESGRTLGTLLGDILDLGKIEADRVELETCAFEPSILLNGVAALFAPQAADKGVTLEVDLEDMGNTVLLGDPTRIRQIVGNLLSNALKFTDAGRVTLSVRIEPVDADTGRLVVQVSDTGVGIDEAMLSNLFDRFVQADGSITRRYGGSGLGLAICRGLARLMGGDIEATSQVGAGSAFTFSAPLRRASAPTEVQPHEPATADLTPALSILLVEDHPNNQRVVELLLQPFGVDLHIAGDGQAGLETFQAGEFDLVLMDMQMPVMDGLTATRAIRQFERESGRPAVPILMMTANASDRHQTESIQAGADGYLTKPLTTAALISAIEAVLDPPARRTPAVDTRGQLSAP